MRSLFVLLCLGLLGAPLAAQERVAYQPAEGRPYSAAVEFGNIVWLSGKIGVTDATEAMTEGRVTAETRNIMEAFATLLSDLDLDFGNVVQGTVYLTDMDDYAEMNAVYGEYFPVDPPARATVAVSEIVSRAVLEISFVAVRD